MSHDILRVRDFNPTSSIVSSVEANKGGQGKGGYVNYAGMPKFRLQLPRMHAPFGMSEFTDDTTGRKKYDVALSFGKSENMKGTLKLFHQKMFEWDDLMLKRAHENCVDWFKKPKKLMTENVLRKNYTPFVNRYKDDNGEYTELYPDRIKLKIPYWDGKFSLKVYNEKQELVGVEYITPHCEVIAVVKSFRLWVSGDKFGVIMNAEQLQVFPPERLTGFSMLPDLESESSEGGPVSQPNQGEGGDDSEGAPMSVSEEEEDVDAPVAEDEAEDEAEEEDDEEPEIEDETSSEKTEPEAEPEAEVEAEVEEKPKKRGRARGTKSSTTSSKKSKTNDRFAEMNK